MADMNFVMIDEREWAARIVFVTPVCIAFWDRIVFGVFLRTFAFVLRTEMCSIKYILT